MGHFNIERKNVRLQLRDSLQADYSIGCRTYYLQLGVFAQDLCYEGSDHYGIIHNQDADPLPWPQSLFVQDSHDERLKPEVLRGRASGKGSPCRRAS